MKWPAVVAGAALLLDAGVATAGRRRFAWLGDTDVLAERTVELEWWITENTGGGPSPREAYVYTAAVVGLTDNLELDLPVEAGFTKDGAELEGYGADLRWRLASADPAAAGPLVPLVRLGARRLVALDAVGLEGDLTLSIDLSRRVRAIVDVAGSAASVGRAYTLTGGAGVSVSVLDELQIGAEAYAHEAWAKGARKPAWVDAGPNLLFTHGRIWVTAAFLIGLHREAPDFLARIIWGVAL